MSIKKITVKPTAFQKKVIDEIEKRTNEFAKKNKKPLTSMREFESNLVKRMTEILNKFKKHLALLEKESESESEKENLKVSPNQKKISALFKLIDNSSLGCQKQMVKKLISGLLDGDPKSIEKMIKESSFVLPNDIKQLVKDYDTILDAFISSKDDVYSYLIENIPFGVCVEISDAFSYSDFYLGYAGELSDSLNKDQIKETFENNLLNILGIFHGPKWSRGDVPVKYNECLSLGLYNSFLFGDGQTITFENEHISSIFRQATREQITEFVMKSEIDFSRLF